MHDAESICISQNITKDRAGTTLERGHMKYLLPNMIGLLTDEVGLLIACMYQTPIKEKNRHGEKAKCEFSDKRNSLHEGKHKESIKKALKHPNPVAQLIL